MVHIPTVNTSTKFSSSTGKYTLYSAKRISSNLKNPLGVAVMSRDL